MVREGSHSVVLAHNEALPVFRYRRNLSANSLFEMSSPLSLTLQTYLIYLYQTCVRTVTLRNWP
jgi:hypothetical protein